MRILLDTNIIIHRETEKVVNDGIGKLFKWLDHLKYDKCIHPLTINEISEYSDKSIVESFKIKMESYNVLKTIAPMTEEFQNIVGQKDTTPNSKNDTLILNELYNDRVQFIITEDRGIHKKAKLLNIDKKVFTIDSFLEKVISENPDLINYKTLSVHKEHFGNIDLKDPFFDSFRTDYDGFDKWFNNKSDQIAYVCKNGSQIYAFLYLKVEDNNEDYSNITPIFSKKRRIKIGTFKVILNGLKLGERFIKIIFDNAINYNVDEIYVTIFPKRQDQFRLINILEEWGFIKYGTKTSTSGIEDVYVRNFNKYFLAESPRLSFPFISQNSRVFLVSIYPDYHTELFPDSILRTEDPLHFVDDQPHRNAIRKVYISRSFRRDLRSGDLIVFYRTGGFYGGVVSTIGIVENIITHIDSEEDFVSLCRKRSVFSDAELKLHWNYDKSNRPFIVNFLYTISFPKRPNLKRLSELGIIKNILKFPRGFKEITKNDLMLILKEAEVNERYIVN